MDQDPKQNKLSNSFLKNSFEIRSDLLSEKKSKGIDKFYSLFLYEWCLVLISKITRARWDDKERENQGKNFFIVGEVVQASEPRAESVDQQAVHSEWDFRLGSTHKAWTSHHYHHQHFQTTPARGQAAAHLSQICMAKVKKNHNNTVIYIFFKKK